MSPPDSKSILSYFLQTCESSGLILCILQKTLIANSYFIIIDFQKFTFQLHVLSGLRKLQRIFQQKIKTIPLTFDIDMQIDPIYLDGVKDGVKKGEVKKAALLVENLLLESKLSIKRIAEFVDETETFVLSIKNRLIQEGKLSVTPKNKKSTHK